MVLGCQLDRHRVLLHPQSSLLNLIPPTVNSLPNSHGDKQLIPANSTEKESIGNADEIGSGWNSTNIPLANDLTSQLTRRNVYPSNLPVGPTLSTISPTIDSLLPTLIPPTVNALPSSSQSNNPLSPANSAETESLGTNAVNARIGSYLVTTPIANNVPPQFTRTTGYPSNLPIGTILSATSPTSDSSLLTPPTVNSLSCGQIDVSTWGSTNEQYPLRNFQTAGQHEANCCNGVLVELQNLKNEVRQLSSLICKSLRSNSSQSNSRRVIEYHRSFVQNVIGECPKNSVRSVVDLNTTLKDPKLGISMVMILVNACKTSKTINSFANAVYDKLVSPGASQDMQWKSSERGSDCRQGLSHLDSLLSVIGVSITGYGAERKQECSTSRVIELIQNARKLSSQTYRKSKNISDLEAKTSAKKSVPVSFPDENFCDVISNLEQKIASLSDAVEKFVPQFPE